MAENRMTPATREGFWFYPPVSGETDQMQPRQDLNRGTHLKAVQSNALKVS